GGFLPLETVYNYEPRPEELTDEEAKHILGAQANLWTEYIKTPEKAEYMAFPRATALSEIVWSPAENKNYEDFVNRLQTQFKRFDQMNVNYGKHVQRGEVEK
ncbi:MAG: family 20 glycosylhydrolase, partial [Cyclobacteriaceae bacterium]|nr:family 20 glycosylhydrolase [Cyclobacteriaceae bacterium]